MPSERPATDTSPSGAAAGSPLSRSSLQDEINSRIYHADGVTKAYRSKLLLDRPETMALLRYQPGFFGRSVLDIGIGTGRTAGFLQPLARRYVCIDYSQEMVDHVRKALPGVEVHLADMRDLSRWGAAEFDFIFAPDNVFDAVSHADRLRILAEARRVLSTEGLLVFSSHNRRYRVAGKGPRLTYSRNPVTQALHVLRYLQRRLNHLRVGRLHRHEDEYALLNDIGHDYALLHYYIDRDRQQGQLDAAGFRLLEVIDSDGRSLREGDEDASSPSLLYVAARK
jgi:SAM-dependent methyltransferase